MNNEITSPNKRARKKVFMVSGGAGRIICALPAFEKYKKINGDDFFIISQSGLEFFLGTEFQDIAFDPTHKGLFKNIIKPNDLINLEPYQEHGYYNQEKSLTEAFDKLVNGTDDHGDLGKPKIILNKTEEINAKETVAEAKKQQNKKYTIVIQPFGREGKAHEGGHVVDASSRSLSTDDYFYISNELRKKYNVISFTENRFDNDDNMYVDADLRHWSGIIEAADYFVGVDSCGQHMAYSFDKPGSVIIGSTFPENITYPNHFNIVEKPNNPRVYSPIRIDGIDNELANRVNDTCMDFTRQELDELTKNILKDIKEKLGIGDHYETKKSTILPPLNNAQKIKTKSKKSFDQLIDLTPKTKSKKSIDKVLEANNIKS